jgi:predicted membrane protein
MTFLFCIGVDLMEFIIGVFVGVIFVLVLIKNEINKQQKANKKEQVELNDEEYYENQRLIRESIKQQQKLIAEMVDLFEKKSESLKPLPNNIRK